MSEITMPAELMAAMNIFGGSGEVSPLNMEDGSQNGSFGSILGLLMADAAQVQAPVQTIPETNEAEASPTISLADILSAAVAGDENVPLPEVFSEKGYAAFIRSVSLFLENNGGELVQADIDLIWKDVSPEERSAFAELLSAAADISEDGLTDDASPADIVNVAARLALKAAKKSDKKISDNENDIPADEAVIVPITDIGLYPVQKVSYYETPDVQTDSGKTVEAVVSESADSLQDPAEIPVYPEMTDDVHAPLEADNKLTIDIRQAFERLPEADPRELTDFLGKLSEKLNASVTVKTPDSTDTAENTADAPAAKTPEEVHIDFGRQNMQSFLARVNRPLEKDMPTEAVIPLNTEADTFSESTPVSDNEEISSQIIRRIDLYRDIFTDNLSEKEIEMKLSPEELGGLEIRIRRSDKGFEITFTAEKAEAAELISGKTSELAEAMASRGIALKEISVSRQIVTNEADGSLTDNGFTSGGGLFGGAQDQSSSDRPFTGNGSYPSESSSEQQDDISENIFNREAKLWVSA